MMFLGANGELGYAFMALIFTLNNQNYKRKHE